MSRYEIRFDAKCQKLLNVALDMPTTLAYSTIREDWKAEISFRARSGILAVDCICWERYAPLQILH